MDEPRAGRTGLARTLGLVVVALLAAHGVAWFEASTLVDGRLARARGEAAARSVDLRVGAGERAGYPLAAGVVWHDVELGPRGLPFGVRLATGRVVLTVVPSLLHAPTYRAELPDPVRLTLPDGAAFTLTAQAARVEAPWGDPATPTLTASGIGVAGTTEVARVARAEATLHVFARTLVARAEGVELPTGVAPGTRIASASAELALDGPPFPALAEAGQVAAALAGWRDAGGAVRLVGGALGWGPTDVEAAGRASLDGALRPVGQGELRVAGGGEGLGALAAAGVLAPHGAQAARALVGLLPRTAKAAGRDAVRLPFSAGSGLVSVAGYPLLRVGPLVSP